LVEHGRNEDFKEDGNAKEVGKVTKSEWEDFFNAILFEAEVKDEKAIDMIKNGTFKAVSLSTWMDYINTDHGKTGVNFSFEELSLVKNPACSTCFIIDVPQTLSIRDQNKDQLGGKDKMSETQEKEVKEETQTSEQTQEETKEEVKTEEVKTEEVKEEVKEEVAPSKEKLVFEFVKKILDIVPEELHEDVVILTPQEEAEEELRRRGKKIVIYYGYYPYPYRYEYPYKYPYEYPAPKKPKKKEEEQLSEEKKEETTPQVTPTKTPEQKVKEALEKGELSVGELILMTTKKSTEV